VLGNILKERAWRHLPILLVLVVVLGCFSDGCTGASFAEWLLYSTLFHPGKPPRSPAEDDDEDEKDSKVFSLLGKKSQNGSRKYSLKVVARQRQ
jgi:hypothetical protein